MLFDAQKTTQLLELAQEQDLGQNFEVEKFDFDEYEQYDHENSSAYDTHH